MLLLQKGAAVTGTTIAAFSRKRPCLPVVPLERLASSSPSPPTVTFHRTRPPTATAQNQDDAQASFAPLAHYLGVGKLEAGRVIDLSKEQLVELLTTQDDALVQALYSLAEAATSAYFGTKVYARGIVEFSNVCTKDCLYCGIRKHMKVHRYTMTKEEIVTSAEFAYTQGMGTLMLQSGELPTPERINFMLDVVRAVRLRTVEMDLEAHPSSSLSSAPPSTTPADPTASSQRGLAVALSLGELPSETYKAFYEAGASRYLLRIESSNPILYHKLHPPSHSFEARRRCLDELRRIGFQVGTGVMVGVPYQEVQDMAGDLLFFKDFDPDMIGLGPYIVQAETPLGQVYLAERQHRSAEELEDERVALLERTTRMYALARLILGNVNIAATTALQALDPQGRELALRRGANVVMPIITPQRLREEYQIYENKPGIDQDALESTACLDLHVQLAGKELLLDGKWHDPPHYLTRKASHAWPHYSSV